MQGPHRVLFFINCISGPCIITQWLEMIHLKDLFKEGRKVIGLKMTRNQVLTVVWCGERFYVKANFPTTKRDMFCSTF